MSVPMVNIIEFAQILEVLDNAASPRIVDRALRSAGLERRMIKNSTGFIPYRLEAQIIEHVARSMGDRLLGARLSTKFDYGAYNAYSRYVLSAQTLELALKRGQRAFSLLHSGTDLILRRENGYLLIGRRSGLTNMIGHRHLDDAAIQLMVRVVRFFLGTDWSPDWIETVDGSDSSDTYLQDTLGAPVHVGTQMPAIAVRECDLAACNPFQPNAKDIVTFAELPRLMGVNSPRSMSETVAQILQLHLPRGDLSEETVASTLSLGRRTLQRALIKEATTFREIKARFIEGRARALLVETDLDVASIAQSFGYNEPRSFHRAFREMTGMSPTVYRARMRGM